MRVTRPLYDISAVPGEVAGFANRKAAALELYADTAGIPVISKALVLQGFTILIKLSPAEVKIIILGGSAFQILFANLSPDIKLYGYDYNADSLTSPLSLAPLATALPLHPFFNYEAHLGTEQKFIDCENGLKVKPTYAPRAEKTVDTRTGLYSIGYSHAYELELLSDNPPINGSRLFAKVGDFTGEVSNLPPRGYNFAWAMTMARAQGQLIALPGAPREALPTAFNGYDMWAFNPYTKEVFPYWSWEPNISYARINTMGVTPGWYYGVAENMSSEVNVYAEYVIATYFNYILPWAALDVHFGCLLDNRKREAKRPYGYCEWLVKTVRSDETADPSYPYETKYHWRLFGYLTSIPPTTNANVSDFASGLTGGVTTGASMEGKAWQFDADLTEYFAPGTINGWCDIEVRGTPEVELWNFRDRKDDEDARLEAENIFHTPRSEDTVAFVAWQGTTAVVGRIFGVYPRILLHTTQYHSHSVSSDGTILAVFESSGGSVITNVKVYDLYFGEYGELPRNTEVEAEAYYVVKVPPYPEEGEAQTDYYFRVIESGVTAVAVPVEYMAVEGLVVQDGGAKLQYDGKGLRVQDSVLPATISPYDGIVIPWRGKRGRYDEDYLNTYKIPYNLQEVTPKVIQDNIDPYTYRSSLGLFHYQLFAIGRSYSKVFTSPTNPKVAYARTVTDYCYEGNAAQISPGTLTPGSTQYTVTIEGNEYKGTYRELSRRLPYLQWSLYDDSGVTSIYDIVLAKWQFKNPPAGCGQSGLYGAGGFPPEGFPVPTYVAGTVTPGTYDEKFSSRAPYGRCYSPGDPNNPDLGGGGDVGGGDGDLPAGCATADVLGLSLSSSPYSDSYGSLVDVGSSFAAAGGVGPYSFESDRGSGIAGSGTITSKAACGARGTPATETITVTDACGSTASLTVRLTGGTFVPTGGGNCTTVNGPYQDCTSECDCEWGFGYFCSNSPEGSISSEGQSVLTYISPIQCRLWGQPGCSCNILAEANCLYTNNPDSPGEDYPGYVRKIVTCNWVCP